MDQQPTFNIIQSLRLLGVGLLLLVACNTYASSHFPLPENHQSTYSVTKYGAEVGQIKNHFLYQDQQITYTSKAKTTGMAAFFLKEVITETSQLYWPGDNALEAPQQTSYAIRHKKKKKKDQDIAFTWSDANHVEITSSYKNKSAALTSDKGVWSTQLLPILMSSYLLQNDKTTGDTILVADKNRLENYDFTLEGNKPIKLNGSMHSCLKFKIFKQNSSRFTYAWLSKDHYYLPLRMEQYKDNELSASMRLEEFKLLK
jgi:Protein of unknown function (DUF3108)